ncbi:MAG: DUF2807 domain-containing protein [Saprospiraceae bacterium]|nr:DUF2807 domain-containing protein [Saprospiraceae bacterium]
MKKLLYFSLLCSIMFSLNSCFVEPISGSGRIGSESRVLSNTNFTEIRVEGSMDVLVKQGDSVKIVAKDFENLLPYLETRVVGNALVVSYRDNTWVRNTAGEVTVTMPRLTNVELSGSGNIGTVGSFNFNDIGMNISGSGNFSFIGTAKNMNAKVSGSGDIRAYDLVCDVANVKISGSGNMQLNIVRQLDATISGSGDIIYKGTPSVSSSVSGSGKIRRF